MKPSRLWLSSLQAMSLFGRRTADRLMQYTLSLFIHPGLKSSTRLVAPSILHRQFHANKFAPRLVADLRPRLQAAPAPSRPTAHLPRMPSMIHLVKYLSDSLVKVTIRLCSLAESNHGWRGEGKHRFFVHAKTAV